MLCESNPDTHNETTWWHLFFDRYFADLFLTRDEPEKLAKEVDFIINELRLQPGQTVLDQCCGIGEITCAIAEKNIHAIGVDQAKPYIDRAIAKAKNQHLSCEFYHGDALEFTSPKLVDATFNWWSSFGYSDNDSINFRMLKNGYDNLKKGGVFLLDYSNPAYIFKNFNPHMTIEKSDFIIHKQSEVDLQRGMYISTWHYICPDGKMFSKSGESRIYFARDLSDMLKQCGFNILKFSGDTSGSSFSKDSQRCIITAQK